MTDRENRLSLPALAGDGLLLVCALAGLAGSFLTLYGGEGLREFVTLETTPLDLCAARSGSFLWLAGLLALVGLAVWSLPRFRWAAAGGLALLLGLFAYSQWDTMVQGAGLTLRTVTAIFAQRVSWGQAFQYDPALTQTEGAAAVRLFLSLVLAALALALGWAVVRAKRWWIVLLLTLPPLLPGLLADLYPSWPPFMALAACWCAMLLCDLCKWSAPSNRGKLTLVVLPCTAAALALITLAFPREGYTRPQWARNIETAFYDGTGRLAEFFSQFDGPFQSRVTYVGSAEEADLAHAGPLNYTGRTVLRVKSDYDGRLYLRGSSLADYEDGVWKAMTDEAFQEAVRPAGAPPRVLFFPAMSAGQGPQYTVTVDNVGAVGSCVYAPYFPTVQDLEENGMTMVNDSLFARRQGWWSHTISFADLPEPHPTVQTGEVTIVLPVAQAGVAQEGSADFAWYSNFVMNHYLDVPEDLRDAQHELFQRYGWRDTLGEIDSSASIWAAKDIAVLLDYLCEYDPEVPAAPEGVDPVLYFLNDSHRGYCMHFASAATLMLRSLGIPARYVSGFTVDSVPGQPMAVPDRAAHAWVEVWVSGFGWYPVEVTPPAAFTWYEQGVLDPEDLPSAPPQESEEPDPTPTPSQNAVPSAQPSAPQEVSGGESFDWAVALTIAKALAIAIAGAVLLWLGQYLPKKLRAKRLSSPDRNRAALDAYGCLLRIQRWGGRMDERAVDLAQKARFSQHTLTQEELDELRELVDIERERLCILLDLPLRLAFRYFWGMPVRPKIGEIPEKNDENGA